MKYSTDEASWVGLKLKLGFVLVMKNIFVHPQLLEADVRGCLISNCWSKNNNSANKIATEGTECTQTISVYILCLLWQKRRVGYKYLSSNTSL